MSSTTTHSDVGRIVEKPWGTTETILASEKIHVELIRVVAGGYSSKHYHKNKDNLFYVVSGKLFVRIFKRVVGDGSIILDERRSCLYPFLVSWGIIHQFEEYCEEPLKQIQRLTILHMECTHTVKHDDNHTCKNTNNESQIKQLTRRIVVLENDIVGLTSNTHTFLYIYRGTC